VSSKKKRTARLEPVARRRTAAAAPQRRTLGWKPIALGVGAVVVAVAGLITLAITTSGGDSSNELAQKIEDSSRSLPQQDGLSLGDPKAPLVLQVFEDFQCPFCIRFTANVEPQLVEEYVKTGKVRLEFQNFPILGHESQAAARGMVCAAEQDRAWNFGLGLYALQANANQAESEKLNVGRFDAEGLRDEAAGAGLDTAAFDTCMAGREASDAVAAQAQAGTVLGVNGTPGFALNGQLIPNPPSDIEGWRTLLGQALAQVGN